MNTAVLTASTETDRRSMPRLVPRLRGFYVGMALLMTAIVLAGFWPSYFGLLVRGAAARPWVIHVHAAVFIGWMVLLLVQVALVASGRTRAHRKLGTFGMGYGVLVLVIGLVVSFASPVLHLVAGEWEIDRAASFLLLPLGDMVLFAGFFGAAIAYRSQSAIHKRLIVLATVALLFAAAARLAGIASPLILLLVWLFPLLVAIGHDGLTLRRIHPTYLIGTAILLVGFCRIFFMQSESWLGIGRTMLTALMQSGS